MTDGASDWTPAGTRVVLDTDSGVVTIDGVEFAPDQVPGGPIRFTLLDQTDGPGLGIFGVDSLVVGPGVTIADWGTRALVLVARSTIDVPAGGTVDVSAPKARMTTECVDVGFGVCPGPGGGHGASDVTPEAAGCGAGGNGSGAAPGYGGGGGGGYGGFGGAGGEGTDGTGGAAGSECQLAATPLVGGSGGGAAIDGASRRIPGGGGGGAIQLTAFGSIRIAGAIMAAGAGGTSSTMGSLGGGGGSGGTIVLDAPRGDRDRAGLRGRQRWGRGATAATGNVGRCDLTPAFGGDHTGADSAGDGATRDYLAGAGSGSSGGASGMIHVVGSPRPTTGIFTPAPIEP